MKKILALFMAIIITSSFTACNKEQKEALLKSNEAFINAQEEEKADNYKKAVELYQKVISEDENYNKASKKIDSLNKLIASNTAYEEGLVAYSDGNYKDAAKKFLLVIKNDKNYKDAQEKTKEAMNNLKTNLLPILEEHKTSGNFEQALSEISSCPKELQKDVDIKEYKVYFETLKKEHEEAIALEKEKQSYDLNSEEGLEDFLKRFYSSAHTCIGTYNFGFSIHANHMNDIAYDYNIWILPESDFAFNKLLNSNSYTSQQRAQAKKELKDFMYKIANDLISRSQRKFMMSYSDRPLGTYYSAQAKNFCTCANIPENTYYDFSSTVYETTKAGSFCWWPRHDEEQW